MTASTPSKLPRLPFVLLGLMTVFTFGGPLAIGYVLRGGASPVWPPDRPIEWATFLGVSGMVAALMLACFSLLLVNRQSKGGAAKPSQPDRTGAEP
jgi:hypothetical protein